MFRFVKWANWQERAVKENRRQWETGGEQCDPKGAGIHCLGLDFQPQCIGQVFHGVLCGGVPAEDRHRHPLVFEYTICTQVDGFPLVSVGSAD